MSAGTCVSLRGAVLTLSRTGVPGGCSLAGHQAQAGQHVYVQHDGVPARRGLASRSFNTPNQGSGADDFRHAVQ